MKLAYVCLAVVSRLYLDKLKTESGSLNCEYRIKRDGAIVKDGLKAKSLRRVKEEGKDVRRGEECGLNLLDYTDIIWPCIED